MKPDWLVSDLLKSRKEEPCRPRSTGFFKVAASDSIQDFDKQIPSREGKIGGETPLARAAELCSMSMIRDCPDSSCQEKFGFWGILFVPSQLFNTCKSSAKAPTKIFRSASVWVAMVVIRNRLPASGTLGGVRGAMKIPRR